MREAPGATALALSTTLAGAPGWGPLAWSWRDGRLLTPDPIPVLRGRFTGVTDSPVPDRVEFTVPEFGAGRSWVPGDDPDHPLAENGQTIAAAIRVRSAVRGETITRIGLYRVHSHNHDDEAHTVSVTAFGVLKAADEAGFSAPEAPRTGATLVSEFRRLAPAGMSVYVHPAVVDRACPMSMQWPSTPLDALYEIADALPARIRVDQWGTVQLLPPLPEVPTPVLTFKHGEGGTLIRAPKGSTREGRPNRVIATGSAVDAAALDPVVGIADITTGPMAVTEDGTGYGIVTEKMASPLLTTSSQARAAARTLLERRSRATRIRQVRCAPDPRVELDDPVAIVRGRRPEWGWVVAYELPWTIDDGDMRLDVGVTS